MKLTVQHAYDATLLVAQIIRERRPFPQKGAYRLARMHAKLLPEFTTINTQRDAMIKVYDHHPMLPGANPGDPDMASEEFSVPVDKMPEFAEAWGKIAVEEIDIDVEPIPLSYLDMGDVHTGSIDAGELIVLGDLVKE